MEKIIGWKIKDEDEDAFICLACEEVGDWSKGKLEPVYYLEDIEYCDVCDSDIEAIE